MMSYKGTGTDDSPLVMAPMLPLDTFVPNPKKHFYISMVKSGIRIFGYLALLINLKLAVTLLVISELIGIYEEMV